MANFPGLSKAILAELKLGRAALRDLGGGGGSSSKGSEWATQMTSSWVGDLAPNTSSVARKVPTL